MISLSEALINTAEICESYCYTVDYENQFCDDSVQRTLSKLNTKEAYIDVLRKMFGKNKKYKWESVKDIVVRAVDKWFDELNHEAIDIPFAFDEAGNCKLRRKVAELIGQTKTSNKIQVGNGSIKLSKYISTESQELATCYVWNHMVQNRHVQKDLDLEKITKTVPFVIDEELSSSWIKSVAAQIQAIMRFIEGMGWDWSEYYMARFGGSGKKQAQYSEVGKAYAKFINGYIAQCIKDPDINVGSQKDTYDPSDVILVRTGSVKSPTGDEAVDYVQDLLSQTAGKDYAEQYKIRKKSFLDGNIIGISLKKVSGSSRFELFNVGSENSEDKISISNIVASDQMSKEEQLTGCKLDVTGTFKFSDMTDPTTKSAEDEIQQNELLVTCRSFSRGKSLDIDIKAKTGPSLGKVPRDAWRTALGVDSSFSVENIDLIKTKLQDKDIMTSVIQSGIKNGPWCLPFVLIH